MDPIKKTALRAAVLIHEQQDRLAVQNGSDQSAWQDSSLSPKSRRKSSFAQAVGVNRRTGGCPSSRRTRCGCRPRSASSWESSCSGGQPAFPDENGARSPWGTSPGTAPPAPWRGRKYRKAQSRLPGSRGEVPGATRPDSPYRACRLSLSAAFCPARASRSAGGSRQWQGPRGLAGPHPPAGFRLQARRDEPGRSARCARI